MLADRYIITQRYTPLTMTDIHTILNKYTGSWWNVSSAFDEQLLVGDKYGTTERKSIPEDEQSTAYDLMTILDAEVWESFMFTASSRFSLL